MARGGARPGAGRKQGAITKRTREIAEKAIKGGLTPLDYMLSVLRNEANTAEDRFEAAKAAAPYVHAKLAAVEHTGKDGDPLPGQSVVVYQLPANGRD